MLTFAGGARVDPASFSARERQGIPFLVTFRPGVDPDVGFDSLRRRLPSIALVIGVPLGIAAGRWGWHAFAERVGALAVPVVSGWIAALIPATILLALAVSFVPAVLAARTRPATVLRGE